MNHHTAVPSQNLPTAAKATANNVHTLLVSALGVVGVYDATEDLATNTFKSLSAADTLSAADAAGSRKFVQLAEEQVGAIAVGQVHLVNHTVGATGARVATVAKVTSVSAAGTGGAKSIGYDVDIHSGTASTADDTLVIHKIGDAGCRTSKMTKKINCYSFALKPEEHQPSGTCNFSRIDNAQLVTTGTQLASSDKIYAVNYNVLRVMSGMGGLAYSN